MISDPFRYDDHNLTLAESAIAFVYQELDKWRDYPSRPHDTAEPKLNANLSKYLSTEAARTEQLFLFNHEEPQEGKRTVDLSAYQRKDYNNTITVFECKRLPSPAKDRAGEYVTGHKDITGGIQRFKLEVHGKKYKIVGMIGYIESLTFNENLISVNNCIDSLSGRQDENGLCWNSGEYLDLIETDSAKGKSHSISMHPRKMIPITIHHLWVYMQMKKCSEEG